MCITQTDVTKLIRVRPPHSAGRMQSKVLCFSDSPCSACADICAERASCSFHIFLFLQANRILQSKPTKKGLGGFRLCRSARCPSVRCSVNARYMLRSSKIESRIYSLSCKSLSMPGSTKESRAGVLFVPVGGLGKAADQPRKLTFVFDRDLCKATAF